MSNTITASVVMTTYNGAKYLIEQMESIRHQSFPLHEVIILDDCSSDDTAHIVKDYIKTNNLSNWRLVENKKNIGWKENFKSGFDLAVSKYIFPCDQDDIWNIDKCERMIRIMEENPQISVLASNYTLFFSEYDSGQNSYRKAMVNNGAITKVNINEKWCHVLRPGCTYCFRKEFYNSIRDSWDCTYAHDAILWRYACINEELYIYNESLIQFRRHGDNVTSQFKVNKNNRVLAVNDCLHFYEVAAEKFGKSNECIINGLKWANLRKDVVIDHKILKWPLLFIKYRSYYMRMSGCIADLYIAFVS